ncbi:hypothetical protein [Nitrospira defluvii]|uniref:Uncharacterized protein n=2 Tax=Nitrospira TaxID=1234 RepID=A0AA86MZ46_9BACT|nr:hypothetical protein [Nitrospira defluvii]CAE6784452.1 conserved hypothetical protein [Nitrospira defluvii]CAI4031580.1 hypothetical protein DNFV4_02000 [Nitrospira tepida]
MKDADDILRSKLQQLLKDGLKTEVEPRAYTSEMVTQLVSRLQAIPPDHYADKLTAAGVTLTPYAPPEDDDDLKQSCETCMYFVIHRQFCDLPELHLPVEKDWSCRLWRI